MARKSTAVRGREERSQLVVKDGQVEVQIVPQEIMEAVTDEATQGPPKVRYATPQGEAVYEYVGNCRDCRDMHREETNLFKCVSDPIRADNQVGIQLAAWWREGRTVVALCQTCHQDRLGHIPRSEPTGYRVLPK